MGVDGTDLRGASRQIRSVERDVVGGGSPSGGGPGRPREHCLEAKASLAGAPRPVEETPRSCENVIVAGRTRHSTYWRRSVNRRRSVRSARRMRRRRPRTLLRQSSRSGDECFVDHRGDILGLEPLGAGSSSATDTVPNRPWTASNWSRSRADSPERNCRSIPSSGRASASAHGGRWRVRRSSSWRHYCSGRQADALILHRVARWPLGDRRWAIPMADSYCRYPALTRGATEPTTTQDLRVPRLIRLWRGWFSCYDNSGIGGTRRCRRRCRVLQRTGDRTRGSNSPPSCPLLRSGPLSTLCSFSWGRPGRTVRRHRRSRASGPVFRFSVFRFASGDRASQCGNEQRPIRLIARVSVRGRAE